ncbi:pentapeptide repeat-containing protein [Ancylothrix sp. C2]|uniref:pentapeptide repeat-containing protein n=1 Tax=Ancylothrix sp. D3o TaxID=2953691 RepID=UPI0021BAA293|nr:pentapeptide repeat-containing protein [Ancylothrix sp. D3o]MCT7949757.1 pentapeptide repeat-containing protein [Ancylothrix sp. D3o]
MQTITPEQAHRLSLEFLEKDPQNRLEILNELGLGRYEFLTKLPLTEANIPCVMRFLGNRQRVKFPNLQGADLAGLNLEGVNFIRGNLTNANLQNSCLIKADLLFVNFTNANLTNADLTAATLNETIWLNAIVEGCNLKNTTGLTQQQRQDLTRRGAIF